MIENKSYKCALFDEFNFDMLHSWFNFKRDKFLHNVDTFYYSVKLVNDLRYESKDPNVVKLRNFFKVKYDRLSQGEFDDFYLPNIGKDLILKQTTFSHFYNVCLSYPEYFDIFIAPVVPKSADGSESLTCEIIVQLRSYFLWMFGMRDAFENSYRYVKAIIDYFNLKVDFVQENRVDYCWHSNYLTNPEQFFAPDNFYKMRVDRFRNATYVTNKVGSEGYEIDYVALGKRSDKVFVRIYQKTREVIEQGYKPWFLKVWHMEGLISNYDLFVYERAYQKRSWFYRFIARLEFYAAYGSDEIQVKRCKDYLSGNLELDEEQIIKLADKLTPRLNYVINVEFQTMRRHSKSYQLVPFKNHSNKGECARIYDYMDNRKLITDYLTSKTLRLTVYDPDVKKSDRDYCAFWKALRKTKMLDVKKRDDHVKLLRDYNSHLSKEAVKKRFINSAVTFGLYNRGNNTDNPLQDAFEAMLRMNDNDIKNASRYKTKKYRQLNKDELADTIESNYLHPFEFVDSSTGEVYTYDTLVRIINQEEALSRGFIDAPEDFSFSEE